MGRESRRKKLYRICISCNTLCTRCFEALWQKDCYLYRTGALLSCIMLCDPRRLVFSSNYGTMTVAIFLKWLCEWLVIFLTNSETQIMESWLKWRWHGGQRVTLDSLCNVCHWSPLFRILANDPKNIGCHWHFERHSWRSEQDKLNVTDGSVLVSSYCWADP